MTHPHPLRAEEVVDPDWIEWYRLSPMERWEASERLWVEYVALGGSLDPEVDSQSPFWSEEEQATFAKRTAAAQLDRRARATPPDAGS